MTSERSTEGLKAPNESSTGAEPERLRLLELQADVGAILAGNETLTAALQHCAEAIVRHLGAAFARIWTLSESEPMLELQASAGMYTHLDGAHGRVPVGKFKIGLIAEERAPHLTNQVVGDPRVGDQAWAMREGMVAFAGYPLLVADRLVGVVALFARHALHEETLRATGAIASSIAQTIDRARAQDRMQAARAAAEAERARLYQFLMQAPAVICVLEGPSHVFKLANPLYRELVGGREMVGKPIREALPEVEGQGFFELLDGVRESGEPFVGKELPVSFVRDATGTPQQACMNFVYQPMRGIDGKVESIFVHAVEVTEQVRARKEIETALAESARLNEELATAEQVLRSLVDNLPELAWSARPDGHIDFYNKRWYEYTGTTFEQMEGWGWKVVHDPAMVDAVTERWQRSLDTGQPFEMEFPLRGADGELRWFLTRVAPLRDGTGRIVRWFGTNTNVHEQREASRRTEALLAEVSEQAKETAAAVKAMREARDTAERRLAECERAKAGA